MTTQLVLTSSLFDTVAVAAAVDAGLLGQPDQRILLQSRNGVAPELVPAPSQIAGADRVLTAFDRVLTLNDLISPQHPISYSPLQGRDRAAQALVLQRLLRSYWDLGDDRIELVLETLTGNPAVWLCAVFFDSPVTVISDGLMSYGPTRNRLPFTLGQRIEALVHVDLVPGVRPVLLHELGVPVHAIPNESITKAFADLADGFRSARPDALPVADHVPSALVLGQYLADLRLLSRAEEDELQAELIWSAVDAGAERVWFKPHPASPPGSLEAVRCAAEVAGVELRMITEPVPAEVLVESLAPVVVAASFSTALMTSRALYDCRIASVGTEVLLRRLRPYANSNRIPVTLVDALTRPDSPYGSAWELQTLVDAVAHAMQPWLLSDLRGGAEAFWATRPTAERARYGPTPRATRALRNVARRSARALMGHPALAPVERRTRTLRSRRRLVRWARV